MTLVKRLCQPSRHSGVNESISSEAQPRTSGVRRDREDGESGATLRDECETSTVPDSSASPVPGGSTGEVPGGSTDAGRTTVKNAERDDFEESLTCAICQEILHDCIR